MKCTLTRWTLSSALDSGRALPDKTLAHVAGCPACAAYRERLYLIDAQLRSDTEHAPRPHRASAPTPARWPVLAALAAAAVVALLVLKAQTLAPVATPAPTPAPVAVAVPPPTPPPVTESTILPVMHSAERLSVGRLDREWENLVADSRSGIDHVLTLTGL